MLFDKDLTRLQTTVLFLIIQIFSLPHEHHRRNRFSV